MDSKKEHAPLDITAVIKEEAVKTYFQPLVSIRSKKIIGYEALARGINHDTGEIISPLVLFDEAIKNDCVLELDRLCRRVALESFSSLGVCDTKLISLNINVSTINAQTAGSNYLLNLAESFSIPTSNIVIEILENEIEDVEQILRFTELYRKKGFLIALDDIGTGHSNLDRISLIKPDIIKLDRSLVHECESDFYRQEVMHSIVSLSHRAGSLVIAEGIETLDTAIAVLKAEVDILQGYFFSKPNEYHKLEHKRIIENLDTTAVSFRERMVSELKQVREKRVRYESIIKKLIKAVAGSADEDIDLIITRNIKGLQEIECVYLIDNEGIQISSTIFTSHNRLQKKNPVFRAADKGSDHSFKNYCYFVLSGLRTYTTLPYISFATGDLCITISTMFKTEKGVSLILCCDINVNA